MADEQQGLEVVKGPQAIDINNICDGTIPEAFNVAMQRVLANVFDLTTPATTSRAISLTLTIKPDGARTVLATSFDVSTKLAPMHNRTGVMYAAADDEGNVYALTKDPRQQRIVFTPPAPKEVPEPIKFTSGAKK